MSRGASYRHQRPALCHVTFSSSVNVVDYFLRDQNWLPGIGAPSISAECRAQGRPGRTGSWDISRAEPAPEQVMERPSDSRYSTPSSAVTPKEPPTETFMQARDRKLSQRAEKIF
ncbi:hypothetical protein KOW79_017725 [Hemibagrus wyckioides]|uniref:Uncharacterized protein n=1 Tax=Hemibagrus wyckioides TaxID=337641 RepID=A0A9D3SCC0_9TELE|nr:hypothetical protein KOW79_017725 [Hemibagrus wyckioides]